MPVWLARCLLYRESNMKRTTTRNPSSGFTLLELLVTFAILMTLILLTAPALARFLTRTKLVTVAEQTAVLMRLARVQAIKFSNPAVVRQLPTTVPPSIIAFVDTDRDSRQDADEKTIGSVLLPKGVSFGTPIGFVADPVSASLPPIAVFLEGGSVDVPTTSPPRPAPPDPNGSFRFIDVKGNQMEVRVELASTGRIEIRKLEGINTWITAGQGGVQWTWK